MSECEKLEKCPFFNDRMADIPTMTAILKRNYCLSNKEGCARYMVASAGKPVPGDLFPNNVEAALALLQQG